jgi:membrane associated rhomboid family serine protease
MPPETWIQIAWTANAEALASWRLTLEALAIPSRVERLEPGGGWLLLVDEADGPRAREALRALMEEERAEAPLRERERRREEAEREEAPLHRLSWIPGALFAAALIEFTFLAGLGAGPWFDAGANVLPLTRGAEPWRAVTALTLHGSWEHLLLNAIAAMFLLPLACEYWGAGLGIWLTVLAGAAGNAIEARLGGGFTSVGASTALFGALGVAGGTRVLRRGTSWGEAFRIAVVVLVTFAMFGLGGESRDPLQMIFPGTPTRMHVDILAHVLGLTVGLALGAAARALLKKRPGALAQWLWGALTLALAAGAWTLAFHAGGPRG